MTASEKFVGPFYRLIAEVGKMPPLVWEGHDAATVGWDGKPDPEQWAAVQWMAKNVRPELLAHQTFRALRASGLIDIGEGGVIRVLTPEQKAEQVAVRAKIREENREERKRQRVEKAALLRRRMSPADFVKWISEYARLRGGWPTVEGLLAFVTTDADGPRQKISRMTLHRYRVQAEKARQIVGARAWRNVTLSPGPAFPAELIPSTEDDPQL